MAPKHGTSSYDYRNCTDGPDGAKCDVCKAWNRKRMSEYRRSKGVKPATNRPVAEHGTRSMYNKCTAGPGGSKCAACKKANTEYVKMYNKVGGYTDRASGAWLP